MLPLLARLNSFLLIFIARFTAWFLTCGTVATGSNNGSLWGTILCTVVWLEYLYLLVANRLFLQIVTIKNVFSNNLLFVTGTKYLTHVTT